jgi:short-subunit dehydrogenase
MKNAIVVGASSGIGAALAKFLAADGYAVGITGRRVELLKKIESETTSKLYIKSFDIVKTAIVTNHLDELVKTMGGLDLLVICSGTGEENLILDFAVEKNTIDTNINGFTAIADWAFNYFSKQNGGHLVAITSIAGLRGNQYAPAYNASKAYQINYMEGLRQKAVKNNLKIYLTDVRPGFVNTAMAKSDKLFWVSPVDKAAKQIYNSIKRRKRIVYITRRWKLIAVILRSLPGWIYERI